MKTVPALLSLVFVAFLSVSSAFACQCFEMDVPYCEQISRADTVFVGTVRSITASDQSKDPLKESLIQFDVEQVYKGSASQVVNVGYLFGSTCSWLKFEIGERWLVYGYREKQGDVLSIPFCTNSHRYEEGSGDIKALYDYREKKSSEWIEGYVTALGRGPIEGRPLSEAKISVTGEKTNTDAQPDKDGKWKVTVPGPGKYLVKVSMPFAAAISGYQAGFAISDMKVADTESVLSYESNVPIGLCSYREFDFERVDTKATGSISGRLLDSDGNPAEGLLNLQPWSPDEKSTLEGGSMAIADANGNYSFDGLREGRYVIVLNRDDFPNEYRPYLRNYLPGVRKFSSAFVIELAQGKAMQAPDFKLPPKLGTRTIEIEASLPDGKPATYWNDPGKAVLMPWISIYREDGKYIEKPDAKLLAAGKYSFSVYEGFSYIVKVDCFGDPKRPIGFAQIPRNGVSKAIKVEVGQKYKDVSEFLRSINPKEQ
jgi:hypothetical protein